MNRIIDRVANHSETSQPPVERRLEPNERMILAPTPLPGSRQILGRLGIDGAVVAAVDASRKSFLLVDTRNTGTSSPFLLVCPDDLSLDRGTGYKGLYRDEAPLIIGRNHYPDRFSYTNAVSREQFQLHYGHNRLTIQNLQPTNPTTVLGHAIPEMPGSEIEEAQPFIPRGLAPSPESRTSYAVQRIRANSIEFSEQDPKAPYGRYMNHPIIGQRSPQISGGVYLGGSAREAIVVDGQSWPLQEAFHNIAATLEHTHRRHGPLSTHDALEVIMHGVQQAIPYNETGTNKISLPHYGDRPVGLSRYVEQKAGVCRHQALLAAFTMEKLIAHGYMTGSTGVERNNVTKRGAHAWAIYRDQRSTAIVVDPTNSFIGTKEEAKRMPGSWPYELV